LNVVRNCTGKCTWDFSPVYFGKLSKASDLEKEIPNNLYPSNLINVRDIFNNEEFKI